MHAVACHNSAHTNHWLTCLLVVFVLLLGSRELSRLSIEVSFVLITYQLAAAFEFVLHSNPKSLDLDFHASVTLCLATSKIGRHLPFHFS